MKLSEKEFDALVKRAIRRIPPEICEHLENIMISVLPKPSKEMLRESGLPKGETLLGLFQGVSLMERLATFPPLYPDTIFLFQEPLEEICLTIEELEEEVEITVVHEVAHFLGMGEERLAELGYA
ncbi:MAG TPA: metallopeptidase family protein [Syntrophorhabdaceae bacterium]|jgi:predicted Zn-dependent protease with MMP-like domain